MQRTRVFNDSPCGACMRGAGRGILSVAPAPLSEVIQSSLLTDAMKDVLQDACDQRATALAQQQPQPMHGRGAGAPRREQLLQKPNNYLTNSDWAALENPRATREQRDEIVVKRLASVGVRHANEDGLI